VPPFIAGTDAKANKCHRSTSAYGMRLNGTAGFPSKYKFVACSGAKIANFYPGKGQYNETAGQLSALSSKTKLVALTIGGNDVQFAPLLATCAAVANCQFYDPVVSSLIKHTGPRLTALYKEILQRAPNAQIYILGYPHLVANKVSLSCRAQQLTNLEAQWINAKTDLLDEAIKDAVSGISSPRMRYVDTTTAFAQGEACSTTHQFVNELTPAHIEYSFHPTKAGQLLLASRLAHVVRES
jgi:lysophospholipase L1-like esterase